MRSDDRVVVFEKIRALEERLDDIDNRLDTLFSSFYCSSDSDSSDSDYEYEPYEAPSSSEKKICKVKCVKKKSGNKKVKPRRNPIRSEQFDPTSPER